MFTCSVSHVYLLPYGKRDCNNLPYMAKVFPFDIVLKIVRKPASYSGPLSDNKYIQQPTLTVSINIKLYVLRGSLRYIES